MNISVLAPSEPLLAEAASHQMHLFQACLGSQKQRDDQSSEVSDLLDQGQRGDVVFRRLVSSAYRCVVRKIVQTV